MTFSSGQENNGKSRASKEHVEYGNQEERLEDYEASN